MPSRKQRRHWERVHQRWQDEVHDAMAVEPDTVAGQSAALSPHHPAHYVLVEAPPPSRTGTAASVCTIQ